MATPALPPEMLISSTSNEPVAVCRKCKRALPLEHFQKNDMMLKTCYQCRDATQLRRRTDRKKVKAFNGILTGRVQLPPAGQMSAEDLTEEMLTSLLPAPRQLVLKPPARSQSVPRPRRIVAANVDGHSLLQLPPDIPDFNDSSEAGNDSTDPDSRRSEDDASSSVEETKYKLDIVTEETKSRISDLRELFEKLEIIAGRGTKIISSLLEKETEIPDHQTIHSSKMSTTPSSKMSIEALTKSPYESTTYGSDDEEDSESEISGPSYFVCLHCDIPRSIGLQYDDDVCAYCYVEQRFCVHGDHEAPITDFVDSDGIKHDVCSECRGKREI